MRGWRAGTSHISLVNMFQCYAEEDNNNQQLVSVLADNGAQHILGHVTKIPGLEFETINLGDEGPAIKGVENGPPIRRTKCSKIKLVPLDPVNEQYSMTIGAYQVDQPGQWTASIPKSCPKWLYKKKRILPIHKSKKALLLFQFKSSSMQINTMN